MLHAHDPDTADPPKCLDALERYSALKSEQPPGPTVSQPRHRFRVCILPERRPAGSVTGRFFKYYRRQRLIVSIIIRPNFVPEISMRCCCPESGLLHSVVTRSGCWNWLCSAAGRH